MSTNLSQQKREKLLNNIKTMREKLMNHPELVQSLAEIETELKRKKYGLVWEEHEEKIDEELKNKIPVFIENKELEIKKAPKKNINFLIEGDNLHSLYLLEKTHKDKIDFIYIDPPYNTENKEFIYDDTRIGIDDGYRHSKWISFMEKRLSVAQRLLSNKGAIFISIDKNEFAQLKLLCDEIFGEKNFIGTLIWRKKYGGGQTDEFFVTEHEYIFGYRKTEQFKWIDHKISISDESYKYQDENGKYKIVKLEKWGSSAHKEDRPTMYFPILNPDGEEMYPIAPDGKPGRWRIGKQRMLDIIESNEIHWSFDKKADKWIPYEKDFKVLKSRSILYDLAETGDATKTLIDIFEEKDKFPNPKPVELINFLLEHIECKNVLDFFAGSGTTAQAVLEFNRENNDEKQFILCTNNENNICEEITYKRLFKLLHGTPRIEPFEFNLKYYKTDYIDRFNNEDDGYYIVNELSKYIKELVQLENAIDINDESIQVFFTDEEIDEFSKNSELVSKCKILYVDTNALITDEQIELFEKNNIMVLYIPEYYFEEEILEVEQW